MTRDKTIGAGFNKTLEVRFITQLAHLIGVNRDLAGLFRIVARSLYHEVWFTQDLCTHSKTALLDFYTLQIPHCLKIFGL